MFACANPDRGWSGDAGHNAARNVSHLHRMCLAPTQGRKGSRQARPARQSRYREAIRKLPASAGRALRNQEITITGSMAVSHSYERAAALFATAVPDPAVSIPAVSISDRLPLEHCPGALGRLRAGRGRKPVVEP